MIDNPLILTFDCGTQSIRALLIDKKGNIVAKEQIAFVPYYSLQPGYAEQKPSIYVDTLKEVSRRIHQNNQQHLGSIVAVTITTIRDTCVCVDKDVKPLRDIIVWLDQREAKCEKPLPLVSRLAFGLVGMSEALQDQRKITKSNWIKENEPEIWANTYKYILLSGYLVYQLTGQLIDSTASQIGHIPFDYKNNKWYEPSNIKFPIFDVEVEKLQEIIPPGSTLGTISKAVSDEYLIKEGLPVIATASDKACETLGCGVLDNNLASLSFGTTATIQTTLRKYVEPQQFMPAYPGATSGTWNPEIQVYRGFWMISWFKKEFAEKEVVQAPKLGLSPEELLNRRLKEIPPGSDGLILQPYWAPMLKQPEAKGCIIGFSSEHTRIHIYKAIIEGIGYGLMEGMQNLEKSSKQTIDGLTVSGGGSQSEEICQITADMFGKPVYKIQTYEACGLGSSMVAFVSLGIYKDYREAIANMVHYTKTFTPNPEIHKIYESLHARIYKRIYKQLRPLYWELRSIIKGREDK
ncbi:MAG: FGGY-family carbohydrate kinase [Bacilli bacterium]|jgi:sugar (pentulose or hexulose) kinase